MIKLKKQRKRKKNNKQDVSDISVDGNEKFLCNVSKT